MKSIDNKNFAFYADIDGYIDEKCILTVYIKHKGLNIICDIQKYTLENDPYNYGPEKINNFIEFLERIETNFHIEELTKIHEISLIFDEIERRYFNQYLNLP